MSVTLEFIMPFQIYKDNFSLILSTITQMRKLESQTLIDLGHFIKLIGSDMKAGLPISVYPQPKECSYLYTVCLDLETYYTTVATKLSSSSSIIHIDLI